MTPGPQVSAGMVSTPMSAREFNASVDIPDDAVYLVTMTSHYEGQNRLVRGIPDLLDALHTYMQGTEKWDGEDNKMPFVQTKAGKIELVSREGFSVRKHFLSPEGWLHYENLPFFQRTVMLRDHMGGQHSISIQRINEMALV
jgi:hypothetical protein